jgi:RNA polymerase sigma-70 factor (ECF subfamily)
MPDAYDPDLERLYDDHAGPLYGFVLNLTRNEADTRDVLQSLFLKLARQPDRVRHAKDPRAFLIRMAHNAAIDLMRRAATRNRRHEDAAADQPQLFEPSQDPEHVSFRKNLEDALRELPPDQRAVVHLKLWENLTFEAIAETLDIPLNTAASRFR